MEVRNWCYFQKKASHCGFVVLWRSEIGAIFRRKQVTVGLLFYGGQKLVLFSEESKSLWVCCFMEVRNWCYLQKKASHCRFVVLWRSKIGAIFRRKQVTVGCFMEVRNWCYLQKKASHCRFVVLWRSKIGAIFRRKQVTVGCFMEVRNWWYLQKKASHCRFVVLWRSEFGAIFRRKQLTVGLLFYGGKRLVLSSEESNSL